jgi:hypothetical protein
MELTAGLQTLTLSSSPRTLLEGSQRALVRDAERPALRTLPPSSMVEQSALNRSIGVRIPGGQPKRLKPELPRTSPNILAREGVVVLKKLQ